jgi:hypothetical protein
LKPQQKDLTPVLHRPVELAANSGLMHRNKFVLFATSLPPLSIGCAITGLIATAVSNHAGMPADVWSNADSWVAKPSQAVQYRPG